MRATCSRSACVDALFRTIAVVHADPWQGYGFSEETKAVLAAANINGKKIHHGDTHHIASARRTASTMASSLHQREAHGRIAVIRPRGLQHQADRQESTARQRARWLLRHPEHRVHSRSRTSIRHRWCRHLRSAQRVKEKYRGLVCSGSSTARRAGSCRSVLRHRDPAYFHDLADAGKAPARASRSGTRSTPRWPLAASSMATRDGGRRLQRDMDYSMSSTGRRPRRPSRTARPRR